MASLNGLHVVAFVLSLNLLMNSSLSFEIVQGSSNGIGEAPSPGPAYDEYLNDCAEKLKPNCGEQILYDIYLNRQTTTKYCCLSLVKDMGKSCFIDVAKYALTLPVFKENATVILNRCEKFWDYCNSFSSSLLV
ncbi:unnamed protein product [Sphenostylis stenocarpa]|uniref:Prolamin-like domain-containing protein n=1 Tax=Sphenostylis stenocarpa TaxID=92480 RepID=A0AA86SF33_9FABA|nr:unnamed protein product [Sphenostylis stenocarpa]